MMADQREEKALVDVSDGDGTASSNTEQTNGVDVTAAPMVNGSEEPPPGYTPTPSEPAPPIKQTKKQKRAAGKLDRLKRSPSLDKVEEESDRSDREGSKTSGKGNPFGCTDFVGVRSYLHNFYEQRAYKDPNVYEEEDYRYLIGRDFPKRKRCASIWWKVFVWIGANFLVFGILGVLVGYLVPEKEIIVGSLGDNMDIIDRKAIAYNFNLDVCKLVGLVLFCIGGLTLTVALLSPSFLNNYFDEDRYPAEAAFKVRIGGPEYRDDPPPPLSPTDKNIPASALVKPVQPGRHGTESVVTKEGMVPYHD